MYLKKRYLLLILLLGAIVVGPRSHFEPVGTVLPQLELDLEEVEAFVAHQEAHLQNLKPDNGSRIVWADSLRRTPYAVVYLHGFSASPVEGAPLHREFARRYGCNLYLPRLAGHGLDDRESFVDLTPEALMASAREALAIGQVLGEKVILMSCSTGSTLSAFLAAAQPEAVDALLMYSPNFALENPATQLLTGPWGLQIARATIGGKYRSIQLPENCHPYWTITYRVEGLVALQGLLDQTMNEKTYRGVMQPFFLGYYYKNEEAR
ncbi:MAG: alpha/beta fold hydrolase, partial [Bacteroidota bacterium]